MARDEIVIDGSTLLQSIKIGVKLPRLFGVRMWIATRLFELAGCVSGCRTVVEVDEPYDEDCPETWQRFKERTPDNGMIVLVRYPEGYQLRYHGESAWKQ